MFCQVFVHDSSKHLAPTFSKLNRPYTLVESDQRC